MKKNVLTLFWITLLTLAGFPSCSDKENKGEAIRNPIAANLPGKWTMIKSYEKKDGEWKEVIEPEGSGTTYLFRTDGSMMSAVTYANHDTYLRSLTWEAEDHKNTFKINYKAYPVEYTLMRLTADELEFGYDKATDYATGATQEGEFKWLIRRIDEEQKNFAERLVGRWHFSKSYEKKNGEWKEITYGIPDEGWHEYTEQGTFITYSRQGDNEHTTDPMQWKANAVTDTVSYKPLDSDKVSRVRITLEDDRTMYVFYSVNFDPATGEMREGEYRDLLLKE